MSQSQGPARKGRCCLPQRASLSQRHVGISSDLHAAKPLPRVRFRDDSSLDSKGTYDYGLRHGKWQFYHPNGQLASEGDFDLGHEHGLWTMYDEEGSRTAHGEFVDGQKEGTWTFWYDNGGVSTGFFKDDELVNE